VTQLPIQHLEGVWLPGLPQFAARLREAQAATCLAGGLAAAQGILPEVEARLGVMPLED
jgi:hypothetical protein